MHPGDFIKEYREHFDLSQKAFAQKMGLDLAGKKRLEKWEQWKKKPSSPKEDDAVLVKRYFGVSQLSDLTDSYLQELFTELVPREMPNYNDLILFNQSLEITLSDFKKETTALRAAVTILFEEIDVLVSKSKKKPLKEVTSDLKKRTQQEAKRLLDAVKKES